MLGLFLTHLAERRYALQVTDHTGKVIQILASALRAYCQCIFAYISAVVADSVAAVECEIVRTVMGSDIEQLSILVLAEMLRDIHVQRRTSVEILHIVLSMKLELVYHRKAIVLRIIEI